MKENLKKLQATLQAEKPLRNLLLGMAVAIVLLIALTILAFNLRANIQREYSAVRDRTGASLYTDLNLMAQTFDMVTVPTADVQYAILPQMKELFHSAVALNTLMKESYSARYALLGDADIAGVESAFAAYDTAFREDSSTDLAQTNMTDCVARIRELLSTRYVSGVLKPTR